MSAFGKVFLVGAGPGDPGLLTLRAAQALQSADVLLYDALASDPTVAIAPASCEKIYVGKRGGDHALPQAEIEALMVRKAREGKRVVRLKGGDPFVFGRGGEEAQTLREAGVPFEIVPGITSAIAAPAYAGIPVTHREHNVAFTVVTAHEDPSKSASTLDWSKLADPHQTLVLLMAMGNLPAIVTQLRENGLSGDRPVAVIKEGTRPTQETLVATLDTIVGEVERAGIGAPAIVIVGEVASLRDQIRWFDTSPLFGKRVLVTRPQAQSESFVHALWSLGAEPVLAPAIAIGPPDDPHPAHAAIDRLHEYAWVVFTSGNGVAAFFDRLDSLDADARYIGRTRVAAIGPKTAETLAKHGVKADLLPAQYVSEEIGRALIEATRDGDRVLIYRAQEARDVLPQMLADADRKPEVVAAYKTSFAHDPQFAEKVARCDILTFTSASTVHGFVANLGGADAAREASSGKLVACIGPVTAEAVRSHDINVDVIADSYTVDGLLAALEGRFASPAL
ncbi:MAG: uroporphyrinogen-III C-methyltransferase [Vulcanimicrobiaceae bacterium]